MIEPSVEVIRVLYEMRALLQRGWTQFRFQDKEGRLCILGALDSAFCGWIDEVQVVECLCNELDIPFNGNFQSKQNIAIWNDVPGRKQEDVLRILDGILARVKK